MKTNIVVLWLIIPLLFSPAFAEEVDVSGLVLDRTVTRFGKDFYRHFSTLWRDIRQTQGVNTVIDERVMPRSGTRLTIAINNRVVFVTYFGRRQTDIKQQVERGLYAAMDGLAQARLSRGGRDLADSGY